MGNGPTTRVDPLGLWYVDFNLSAISPYFVGATGGVLVNGTGLYPYFGIAVGVPGAGGSITSSPNDPTTGVNFGAQLQGGPAGQIGYAPGKNGGWFIEVGGGWPPGFSGSGYYVWGPFGGGNGKQGGTGGSANDGGSGSAGGAGQAGSGPGGGSGSFGLSGSAPFMPGPGGPDPGPFSPGLGARKC